MRSRATGHWVPFTLLYPNRSTTRAMPTTLACRLEHLATTKALDAALGGLPEYIVNATTEGQVAIALNWDAEHNIRITVKGTDHEMNAR